MISDTALFMIGLQGTSVSKEEAIYLQNPLCAGVILFSRNFQSKNQLSELTQSIQEVAHQQLLIAVDHEGGRVQRFKKEFTLLPPMASLGKVYEKEPDKAKEYAYAFAIVMAYELLEVGIDFSFAPILDLNNPISRIIGDRAIHSNPNIIADVATSFHKGLKVSGMSACGKHFPGHGSLKEDSHLELPISNKPLRELQETDLIPFIKLINSGIEAIMPAHILFHDVDGLPVGFSNFWLNHVLRTNLGFNGCIISDDLGMQGAVAFGDIHERIRLARRNCDLILICNEKEDIESAFMHTQIDKNEQRQKRLQNMFKKPSVLNQAFYEEQLATLKKLISTQ